VDAVINLWRVMALGLRKDPRSLRDAAGFRVCGPIVKPGDTGIGYGRGAHRARLQRHIQIAACQPFLYQGGAGSADRQHLGVSSWVMQFACSVTGLRQHPVRANNDSAHGDLAAGTGGARLVKGDLHVTAKCHAVSCPPLPRSGKPLRKRLCDGYD
jgi:hypothetical protein